jgi:5'-nucleotidase (lipoprotein e(P4) family)
MRFVSMLIRRLSDCGRAGFVAVLFGWVLLLPAQSFTQAQTPSISRQSGANNEYQIGAILWTQSSAEYRALAYQAFSLAKLRLDQDLRSYKTGRAARNVKRPALIVDVDETVLDNSRYQAELVLRGVAYTQASWQEWCDRAEAGVVPGAADFLNYAFRRGVRVFYITNRRQPEKAGTMANLSKLGFPGVSDDTVVVRGQGTSASKESRRQQIRSRYRIVLLVGDNLNDFTDDFSGKSISDRKAQVDRDRNEFGLRFIVIPNPMYGDWENSINENKPDLTEAERETKRRSALKGVSLQPGP